MRGPGVATESNGLGTFHPGTSGALFRGNGQEAGIRTQTNGFTLRDATVTPQPDKVTGARFELAAFTL